MAYRRFSSPDPASWREPYFHKVTLPSALLLGIFDECAPPHHFFHCALLFGALTQYRSVKDTLLEAKDKLLVTGRYLSCL